MCNPIWESRWDALKAELASLESSLNSLLESGIPRIKTLHFLSQCLHRFATGHYQYFKRHYGVKWPASDEYPCDVIFRGLIAQPYEDLAVIQQALWQRQFGSPAMLNTLKETDYLCWNALQPVLPILPNPDTHTVVTYFQKFASIRIIPYANVALIGLPFSANRFAQDRLAIPHETGHYVFRRSYAIRSAVVQNYKQGDSQPDYGRRWIEEIFADVYGCLVAGPTISLDFQDLQIEKEPTDKFLRDDKVHPAPLLRPHVYHKVLHTFSPQWANGLTDLWKARRDIHLLNKTLPLSFKLHGSISEVDLDDAISTQVDVRDTTKPVDRTIQAALDQLQGLDWQQATAWLPLHDLVRPEGLDMYDYAAVADTIYGTLSGLQSMDIPAKDAPPDLESGCDTNRLDDPGVINTLIAHWETQFDGIEEAKEDWWVDVWLANGWNTYGNGRWVQ